MHGPHYTVRVCDIGIRHFHIAKIWSVNRKDAAVRQQLTKLVLFKNQ